MQKVEDVIESLQIVRSAIIKIEDDQNRLFFWYMLCDVIRRYSNTRSSTYKLHVKEVTTISKMENNVIKDYIASLIKSVDKFTNVSTNFILYKCNVLEKLEKLESELFDISITSPPYGDNATTVPYGQFSMLALYTIDSKDLELDGWELDNYSKIDTNSLGGNSNDNIMNEFERELVAPYLYNISDRKQTKVIRFFNDYFIFMRNICRVTRKFIVLTLGNRTVDRVQINLTNITKTFLENNGFRNLEIAKREIPSKRMPRITSRVNENPVSSMNYEYVIIHERNKDY